MATKSLVDALGLKELLPEEQEEILIDLGTLIFKGSLIRMIELMDDETKQTFDMLMEKDTDEEEILAFLTEKVPGADQAVAETVKELTDDILSATGESQD
jgi:hypothetical protein